MPMRYVPIELRDQNAIERYGMRVATSVSAHEICDENVGMIAGQLMLQRALYIRNTYKFKLAWEFCLLDPMDMVTLTDANLGLPRRRAHHRDRRGRERAADRNGGGISAGVGSAPLYASQGGMTYPINRNVIVSTCQSADHFRAAAGAGGASAQVWVAVSGGSGGVADPNWGGCNVLLSLDGTSYSQIGTVSAPARQGRARCVARGLHRRQSRHRRYARRRSRRKRGKLATATAARCAARHHALHRRRRTRVLCNRDPDRGEPIFADLSLSRPVRDRGRLAFERGAVRAAQQQCDLQIRPADAIRRPDALSEIPSFNVFGGGVQDLSTCAAYTYTPTGNAIDHPVAEAIEVSGGSWDFGLVTTAPTVDDDWGASLTLWVETDLDLGPA